MHLSPGDIAISDDVTFTEDSDLNGASPQFTLTCISTGGSATTVTCLPLPLSLSPLHLSSRVINHSRREGQLPLIDSSLLHTQLSCQPQKSKPRREKDESKCSFSGPSHSLKRRRSIVNSDTSQVNASVINVHSPGARTFQCRDKSAATDKIQTTENTSTPHSTLSKVYAQSTHNKPQHSPVPDCAYLPTPPSRLGRNSFNQWVSVYQDKDHPQGKMALINEPDKNDEELDRASVSKSVATDDKQTSMKSQSGGVMATGRCRKRREDVCFVKKPSKMESDEKYQAVNFKSRKLMKNCCTCKVVLETITEPAQLLKSHQGQFIAVL